MWISCGQCPVGEIFSRPLDTTNSGFYNCMLKFWTPMVLKCWIKILNNDHEQKIGKMKKSDEFLIVGRNKD